jgi:chromosome segregation ATPase
VKLFSWPMKKLETMNRILTNSARQRVERIEQLERALQQVRPKLMELPKRVRELEEDNRQLTERLHELEREVLAATTLRAYLQRMTELEENNRKLTDAIAHCKSCIGELEQIRLRSGCDSVRPGGRGD